MTDEGCLKLDSVRRLFYRADMLRSRIQVLAKAKSREAKPRQWRAMLIRKRGQMLAMSRRQA